MNSASESSPGFWVIAGQASAVSSRAVDEAKRCVSAGKWILSGDGILELAYEHSFSILVGRDAVNHTPAVQEVDRLFRAWTEYTESDWRHAWRAVNGPDGRGVLLVPKAMEVGEVA